MINKDDILYGMFSIYNREHITGGNLHVVLDDGNVEDKDIVFCINEAKDGGDLLGELIGEILLRIPEGERLDFIDKYSKSDKWVSFSDFILDL